MTNNDANLGFTAKEIWKKSYHSFAQYFDLVLDLTQEDFEGDRSGSYPILKTYGAKSAKISSGNVEWLDKNIDLVTLETKLRSITTGINYLKPLRREARGLIELNLTIASDKVLRQVCTEIVNGLVSGAAPENTQTGGISLDKIEAACKAIKNSRTSDGKIFGFWPDYIVFSSAGWNVFAKSDDSKVITEGLVNGMKIITADLISEQKDSEDVHAIVLHSNQFAAFLRETDEDKFVTTGHKEVTLETYTGMVIRNAEAGAVITGV